MKTHDERVNHHLYETLEGIAEQSERIASLEELVLDIWWLHRSWGCLTPEEFDRREAGVLARMNNLGIELEYDHE